jgi:hypothetical protein
MNNGIMTCNCSEISGVSNWLEFLLILTIEDFKIHHRPQHESFLNDRLHA